MNKRLVKAEGALRLPSADGGDLDFSAADWDPLSLECPDYNDPNYAKSACLLRTKGTAGGGQHTARAARRAARAAGASEPLVGHRGGPLALQSSAESAPAEAGQAEAWQRFLDGATPVILRLLVV